MSTSNLNNQRLQNWPNPCCVMSACLVRWSNRSRDLTFGVYKAMMICWPTLAAISQGQYLLKRLLKGSCPFYFTFVSGGLCWISWLIRNQIWENWDKLVIKGDRKLVFPKYCPNLETCHTFLIFSFIHQSTESALSNLTLYKGNYTNSLKY